MIYLDFFHPSFSFSRKKVKEQRSGSTKERGTKQRVDLATMTITKSLFFKNFATLVVFVLSSIFTLVHFLATLTQSKDCYLLFSRLTLTFFQIFNNFFNKSSQLMLFFLHQAQTLLRQTNPLLDRIIMIQKGLNYR